MSIVFSLTEGIKSMAKARLATMLSISSITFTIILIGIFALFSLNLHSWIKQIRQKIEMEVFLKIGTEEKQIKSLQTTLSQIPGIDSISFISKEHAAKRFNSEFGEDVYSILEFNPFPNSFRLTLEERYQNSEGVKKIQDSIKNLSNIDEIVYQQPLLITIDRYVNIVYLIMLIASAVIILIAMMLINNTIRLTIYARKDIIQIMRLVGATEGYVKRPFIVEGILQGFIGSLAAMLIVLYLNKLIKNLFLPQLIENYQILALLIVFGTIMGMVSAYISVGKYLRNI